MLSEESPLDLVMVPVKRTVWLNLYDDDRGTILAEAFDSRAEADEGHLRLGLGLGLERRLDRAWPLEIEE